MGTHHTLINGTAYAVTGGTDLVNGTKYQIGGAERWPMGRRMTLDSGRLNTQSPCWAAAEQ